MHSEHDAAGLHVAWGDYCSYWFAAPQLALEPGPIGRAAIALGERCAEVLQYLCVCLGLGDPAIELFDMRPLVAEFSELIQAGVDVPAWLGDPEARKR